MNGRHLTVFMALAITVLTQRVGHAAPPYSGTAYLATDIITAADPTSFSGISYVGQAQRRMFDRRPAAFITLNAFVFNATYVDEPATIEVQVNPEFETPEAALVVAQKYARVIGRLPGTARSLARTMWIHKGDYPFGGGNNNFLIHTGQADIQEARGYLEETLLHESGHTSLDGLHANAAGWVAAQRADPDFISTYARDNPTREDVAESWGPYLMVRHKRERFPAAMADVILRTIPNRIAYFDSLTLNLVPFVLVPLSVSALSPSIDVDAGGTMTLMVVINGSGPLAYQWYEGQSPDDSLPVAGANAAQFTTPSLTSTTDYWVRSANPFGSVVDSPTVTVRVR
jgi:hypothetical protein